MAPPHPLSCMAPPHPLSCMAYPHRSSCMASPQPPSCMAPPHPPSCMAPPHPSSCMAPPHPSSCMAFFHPHPPSCMASPRHHPYHPSYLKVRCLPTMTFPPSLTLPLSSPNIFHRWSDVPPHQLSSYLHPWPPIRPSR